MKTPVKVILFDDNKRIRDSLRILFTSHAEFEWLGAYEDASKATDLVDTYLPDVVLMDIGLPGISGIEATRAIKKKFPDQPIMMLTIFEDDQKIWTLYVQGLSAISWKANHSPILSKQ